MGGAVRTMTRSEQLKDAFQDALQNALVENKVTADEYGLDGVVSMRESLEFAGTMFIAGGFFADSHPAWISVEDKLPDIAECEFVSDEVLCCTARGVVIVGFYNRGIKELVEPHWHAEDLGDIEVTHWMPLPEPPAKGGEQ